MKKLLLSLAAASLIFSSFAYAEQAVRPTKEQLKKLYTTNTTQLLSAKGGRNLKSSLTEVVVVNATDNHIRVSFEEGDEPFKIRAYEKPWHIRSDEGYFYVPLKIRSDKFGATIFNAEVCPRAIVVAFNNGKVFVDEDLCR